MKSTYDIFISYRRDGGAQYARILQLMLQQRGYRVFLDYDELKEGIFGKRIKDAIKEAPIFMLILSKGSMERCVDEKDWVREEILFATQENKNFVPVNPDKTFDGIQSNVPEEIRNVALDTQRSEIDFGQTLGVTVEQMIRDRLVPCLGKRMAQGRQDNDYDTAQESLRKIDVHNRFMKRLGVFGVIAVISIVLVTCLWFFDYERSKDKEEETKASLEMLKSEIERKHQSFNLTLRSGLSKCQMTTIDTILQNMSVIVPNQLWMSQFEFTVGQWYGIADKSFDEGTKMYPMTNVSLGEIQMCLISLSQMTSLEITLPSADEWIAAARGGELANQYLYAGSDDPDAVGWYKDNSEGKAHPSDGLQGKEPNVLDLYDMSGNVGELCLTPYVSGVDGAEWTVCGGNYNSPLSEITINSRMPFSGNAKDPAVGFRIIIRKKNY